ncbi:MAG: hypothetical protein JXA90_11430, partial [Planctomycetes bacterium]|nr:hypothetical protein [Planctomycetota bacterium]
STIPADYLEKVIRELADCPFLTPASSGAVAAPPASASPSPAESGAEVSPPRSASTRPGRASPRITFTLPAELHSRAKGAVAHLSEKPGRWSLSELVRRGLAREVKRLEKQHNGGEPFPAPADA